MLASNDDENEEEEREEKIKALEHWAELQQNFVHLKVEDIQIHSGIRTHTNRYRDCMYICIYIDVCMHV